MLHFLVIKGHLENLQITDEVLLALMDYPSEAFEIAANLETGVEYIRIKSAYRVRKNKIKAKKTKKNTKSTHRSVLFLQFALTYFLFLSGCYVRRDFDR